MLEGIEHIELIQQEFKQMRRMVKQLAISAVLSHASHQAPRYSNRFRKNVNLQLAEDSGKGLPTSQSINPTWPYREGWCKESTRSKGHR